MPLLPAKYQLRCFTGVLHFTLTRAVKPTLQKGKVSLGLSDFWVSQSEGGFESRSAHWLVLKRVKKPNQEASKWGPCTIPGDAIAILSGAPPPLDGSVGL